MNILLLSPKYPPSQGGVEVQIELLANELVKRGHKVVVITSSEPHAPTIEFPNGVRIFRYPLPSTPLDYWNGYQFIQNNLSNILRILSSEQIDIIHVHQFEMSVSFVHQLREITATPIVVTVHTSLSCNKQYQQSCGILKKMIRLIPIQLLEKQSIREADYLITVSDELNRFCKSVRGDEKVTTIYPAIDLDKFAPPPIPSSQTHTILCPGRISPEKGQALLIDALSIARNTVDINVIFLGTGTESDMRALKLKVLDSGLMDNVLFFPPIPYAAIQDWYKEFPIIVIPSLSESFGLVALENMAVGNTVIASDVGGLSMLIESENNGLLFPPDNELVLAAQIVRAVTNPDLRESIGKNARETAQGYSINLAVNKIERIYTEVIG